MVDGTQQAATAAPLHTVPVGVYLQCTACGLYGGGTGYWAGVDQKDCTWWHILTPNPTVSVEGGIFTLQLQALHQIFTQGCSYACVMRTIATGDEHVVIL